MIKTLISALALAGASLSSIAGASITPVLIGSPVATGSDFAYNYSATLASDQALRTGAFFTLYDFVGFTGFGSVVSNFTATAQNVGVTAPKTLPDDNTSIVNVTFTYNGPDVNYNGALGEREIGTFTVFGSGSTVVLGDFTSFAFLNNGPTKGSGVSTVGNNAVGVAGFEDAGNPNGIVPEPATWGMMLAGMGLVGGAMRRRNRQVVAA